MWKFARAGERVAPRIVAGRNDIAGAVIMVGGTRPVPRAIVEQTEYLAALAGAADEATKERLDAIKREAAGAMAAKAGDVGATFFGVCAPYWADLNSYDPAAAAARLTLPLLILQGGRDYQVTIPDDLDRWRAGLDGRPDVTFTVFDRDNHLFFTGTGPSSPAEYEPAQHVDPAVVEAVATWVAATAG